MQAEPGIEKPSLLRGLTGRREPPNHLITLENIKL